MLPLITIWISMQGLVDTRNQMMYDQRRQLRLEEIRQKKEKDKDERVLQTFKNAVEVNTPHSSVVISPSQKSLAQPESESRPSTHFSTTPLSMWYYSATTGASTNSQHSAEQAPSTSQPLFQSEPHFASTGLLISGLEEKYDSKLNLHCSEGPVGSNYNMTVSEPDADSITQPSGIATSHRTMPVKNRNFTHRSHYDLEAVHNAIVSIQQKYQKKAAKKNK
uniref:Uncharacterized protein n=1 Tax=Sphaerodactylus townsendi TaxID=933632 RepID=A0ACB8G649_9SAUR